MQNLNSINFILVGLGSDSIYEVRNAIQCINVIKNLNQKNIQDLIETLEKMKKHKDSMIRNEAQRILKKLKFNYKGSSVIHY